MVIDVVHPLVGYDSILCNGLQGGSGNLGLAPSARNAGRSQRNRRNWDSYSVFALAGPFGSWGELASERVASSLLCFEALSALFSLIGSGISSRRLPGLCTSRQLECSGRIRALLHSSVLYLLA